MEDMEKRQLICDTGRELLKTGLVARTWGNVSCRAGENSFLITPSGLDYTKTTAKDIVAVELDTMQWQGEHKPSSEKGIHAAAYRLFPEVGFVIHTHQNCASAIGLAGFEELDITDSEIEKLGGLAKAQYGLPGQKKLKNAVAAAMSTGAQTVLMVKHGAVVCGKDKAEAMERVQLLEDICRRNLRGGAQVKRREKPELAAALLCAVREKYPTALLADSDNAVLWANGKKPLKAQLDDMAQMLGARVKCVPADASVILRALEGHDGVFVRGVGAIVKADDPDDAEALRILIEKSALCALHTAALGERSRLSTLDTALMRFVYLKKYSKKKG